MNLADAIRRATHVALTAEPQPFAERVSPVVAGVTPVAQGEESTMNESIDNNTPARPQATLSEFPNSQQSVVRLELLLTPDQLSNLFRAVAANQHSLWTLRDAAAYLRITPKALTALAEEGQVPGFLVDGRWRFAKQGIDDWLYSTSVMKEAA